jgi:phage-related protein
VQEYACIFYETAGGRRPVEEFVESLDQETLDKFIIKQQLLQDFGPLLSYPHTDHLGEGIFELRFKGKEGQIRVLFFFFRGKRIIFTHGFIKKTQKTPQKEIRIAETRRKDFLARAYLGGPKQ